LTKKSTKIYPNIGLYFISAGKHLDFMQSAQQKWKKVIRAEPVYNHPLNYIRKSAFKQIHFFARKISKNHYNFGNVNIIMVRKDEKEEI